MQNSDFRIRGAAPTEVCCSVCKKSKVFALQRTKTFSFYFQTGLKHLHCTGDHASNATSAGGSRKRHSNKAKKKKEVNTFHITTNIQPERAQKERERCLLRPQKQGLCVQARRKRGEMLRRTRLRALVFVSVCACACMRGACLCRRDVPLLSTVRGERAATETLSFRVFRGESGPRRPPSMRDTRS